MDIQPKLHIIKTTQGHINVQMPWVHIEGKQKLGYA
jgi:hypothetical protein